MLTHRHAIHTYVLTHKSMHINTYIKHTHMLSHVEENLMILIKLCTYHIRTHKYTFIYVKYTHAPTQDNY